MRISVIIATYNRATLLDECLTHLARQRFEPGDEVVVVDNGSTDHTLAVIRAHQGNCPVPLQWLAEPRPGKSHALGRGIAIATGDVLAFTDDDVNVDETWIEAIRAAMRADDAALVGGPVVPRWERRAPWWLALNRGDFGRLAAPLALVDYGLCASDLGPRTLLGANLAVRRNVLQQIGGFAPHLGKLRGTLLSGEDHEFCRRAQAAGFRARYSPDARVYHWVPAHRMRFRYFLSWFFWSGITNAALDEAVDQPERGRAMRSPGGVPAYIVRRFVGALVAAPAALAIGRTATAVARAMDASFAAGYAAQRWGLVKLEPAHSSVPAGDVA